MDIGEVRHVWGASEVLVRFYFFILMANAWVCPLCDHSLSCTLVPCELLFIYVCVTQ